MTDYYVRKTGNDGNDGTNPDTQAWVTIDKAANTVIAGDNVYVGAGVYRELVTMDTPGNSSNQISYIADVDGEKTGDAGLVIISAYADETSSPVRISCIKTAGQTFITWRGFVLVGGSTMVIGETSASNFNYEGCIFEDCSIIAGDDAADYVMYLDFNAATTPTNNGIIIRRCVIQGAIRFLFNGNESADQNLKMIMDNCILMPGGHLGSAGRGIYWDIVSGGTFGTGGMDITNCTFFSAYSAVYVENGVSSTYPIDVRNCIFLRCGNGLTKATTNDGALTSDYNTFLSCETDLSNVSAGTDDKLSATYGPQMLGGIGDFPLYRFWGWSPFKPWEPIRLQDDAYIHHAIGLASAAVAPATDLYNNNRPMHGTVDDRGAVEGRARAEKETTTVRTGDTSIRLDGAGFHEILLPVDALLTTVTVWAQYDATYGGTLPQLKALNIPGVVDQTDVVTGSSGTWEQLTVSFTPTSKGIARIRLVSNDTSAGGECFFDGLEVS